MRRANMAEGWLRYDIGTRGLPRRLKPRIALMSGPQVVASHRRLAPSSKRPRPRRTKRPPEEHAVWIKANYTKYEHMIPMRDGVRLFTAVYAPKDVSKPYPIMLFRTPYSVRPYGVNSYKTRIGPSRQFAKDLFIFAYQDVRGRMGSEGEFVNVRPHMAVKNGPKDIDESSDTYDTIDWLVKNVPNNNGKAGQWGISYPGFYTAMGVIDAHPALKAASPQAPVTDWFIGDDFPPQRGFLPGARLPFLLAFWHAGGRADPRTAAALRLQNARRLRVLSQPGAADQSQ